VASTASGLHAQLDAAHRAVAFLKSRIEQLEELSTFQNEELVNAMHAKNEEGTALDIQQANVEALQNELAEAAKRELALKDELEDKQHELSMLRNKAEESSLGVESFMVLNEQQAEQAATEATEMQQLQETIQALTLTNQTLTSERDALSTKHEDLVHEHDLQHQIINRLRLLCADMEGKLDDSDKRMTSTLADMDEMTERMDVAAKEAQMAKDALQIVVLEKEEAVQELERVKATAARHKSQVCKLETQLAASDDANVKLQITTNDLESQMTKKDATLEQLHKAVRMHAESEQDLAGQYAHWQERATIAEAAVESLQRQLEEEQEMRRNHYVEDNPMDNHMLMPTETFGAMPAKSLRHEKSFADEMDALRMGTPDMPEIPEFAHGTDIYGHMRCGRSRAGSLGRVGHLSQCNACQRRWVHGRPTSTEPIWHATTQGVKQPAFFSCGCHARRAVRGRHGRTSPPSLRIPPWPTLPSTRADAQGD
jgi:myosin heavy subunit